MQWSGTELVGRFLVDFAVAGGALSMALRTSSGREVAKSTKNHKETFKNYHTDTNRCQVAHKVDGGCLLAEVFKSAFDTANNRESAAEDLGADAQMDDPGYWRIQGNVCELT